MTVVSDRDARAFNKSRATRAVAPDKSKAFDNVWYSLPNVVESLGFIRCYSLSSPGPIKSPSISIRCKLKSSQTQVLRNLSSGSELFARIFSYCWCPRSVLGPTFSLLNINDLPDNIICIVAICVDNTTL